MLPPAGRRCSSSLEFWPAFVLLDSSSHLRSAGCSYKGFKKLVTTFSNGSSPDSGWMKGGIENCEEQEELIIYTSNALCVALQSIASFSEQGWGSSCLGPPHSVGTQSHLTSKVASGSPFFILDGDFGVALRHLSSTFPHPPRGVGAEEPRQPGKGRMGEMGGQEKERPGTSPCALQLRGLGSLWLWSSPVRKDGVCGWGTVTIAALRGADHSGQAMRVRVTAGRTARDRPRPGLSATCGPPAARLHPPCASCQAPAPRTGRPASQDSKLSPGSWSGCIEDGGGTPKTLDSAT